MCIRDRIEVAKSKKPKMETGTIINQYKIISAIGKGGMGEVCLLYTSDAADERSSVDLGGRRIIKKTNLKSEHSSRSLFRKLNKHTQEEITN